MMLEWILGPLCTVLFVGYIFAAFRQGFTAKQDRSNSGGGPATDEQRLTSGRWSEGGHFF